MLNADELGEKGQSHFRELCADAGLTCNEATRDRSGWDFIVEFRFDPADSNTPIDSRTVPPSCHIQVKTILEKNNIVKLPLSSAERLAKEVKPSFIYILRTNDTLTFSNSFLIHLLDEPLAAILKRLRYERAAGSQSKINHKTISMTVSRYGLSLPPTGLALRAALREACARDPHEYMTKKRNQLDQLGFEGPMLKGEFTLRASNGWGDIVDASLGLKQNMPVSRFELNELRFGISLPIHHMGKNSTGAITITPHPIDQCTLTVRHEDVSLPAVFEGKIIVPAMPGIPQDHLKMLIDCDQFNFTFDMRKNFSLKEKEKYRSDRHTPAELVNHARLLLFLALGGATIEIAPHRAGRTMGMCLDKAENELDKEHCGAWLRLCEDFLYLCERAGISSKNAFLCNDLEDNARDIEAVTLLLHDKQGELRFELELDEGFEGPIPSKSLFVRSIPFQDQLLAYYGIVDSVSAGKIAERKFVCESGKISGGAVRFFGRGSGELDVFMRNLQDREKIEFLILTGPSD